MGILALAAILALLLVFVATALAVAASTYRCYEAPMYWILAAIAAVIIPWLLVAANASSSGGEYSGLTTLVARAFSSTNAICLGGAFGTGLLARFGSDEVKYLSGASWGLLATFVLQLFARVPLNASGL
jgi:hypothetical protein